MGSIDSMECGTVEWNSGMVERWTTGIVERAINHPVPFLLATMANDPVPHQLIGACALCSSV